MPRYIDADKLTDRAYQLNFDKKISERELAIVNRLIAESPTEDVAPVVHAEWKDNGADYKCSNCGNTEPCYDMLYCTKCGAKMDE